MLELMLLIDYGFPAYPLLQPSFTRPPFASPEDLQAMWSFERFSGLLAATAWRWRQGDAIPDQDAWDLILDVMGKKGPWAWNKAYLTWDVATRFYHYHTHRMPVEPDARRQGWTGYTGVLREMVAEVSTREKDRLERRLFFDLGYFYYLIDDDKQRAQVRYMARSLARRYGCDLALRAAPATTPVVDTVSWGDWFVSLFVFHCLGKEAETKGARGR